MLKLNTDGTVDETKVEKRQAQSLHDEIKQINGTVKMFRDEVDKLLARKEELKSIIDQIV